MRATCTRGMVADDRRAASTVVDWGEPTGPTGQGAELLTTAAGQVASQLGDQAAQLIAKTKRSRRSR